MWNQIKPRPLTGVMLFGLLFLSTLSRAGCVSEIPASTPNSQLIDNNDGTITHSKTGLMWKRCNEGQGDDANCSAAASSYTWQQALALPETLNVSGGFAGYSDWRLPNIKELISIVEGACASPAINEDRFPNTPLSYNWSASAAASASSDGVWSAWGVYFGGAGTTEVYYADIGNRSNSWHVRLVRSGQ